jgi:protein TonB
LLVLVILTLGSAITRHDKKDASVSLVRFRASSEEPRAKPVAEKAAEQSQKIAQPRERQPEQAVTAASLPQPNPEPLAPQIIRLSPAQMAVADIRPTTRPPNPAMAASRPKIGPPDLVGPSSDTPRASGSGPNGEPLYAAAWYREPYDDELRGYLSTATGPGWGLIACRTAPDYRVEDCVKIDEYPTGSNIARSVLAAAWQFRVRPPRIGGQPKIGEWVRIRIDYDYQRR